MKALLALLLTVLGTNAAIPPISTWDYQVKDWRDRAIFWTNTVDAPSYRNATDFMLYLRFTGVRRLVSRAGIYLGSGLQATRATFIIDGGRTNDVPVNFVAGDYTTNGLTGNLTDKYLDTGFVPSNVSPLTENSMHGGVYLHTFVSDSAGYIPAGVNSVAAGPAHLIIKHSTGTWIQFLTGSGTFNNVADATGLGFYVSTRTSTTFAGTYKNGVLFVSVDPTEGGGLPDNTFMIHARGVTASVDSFSDRQIQYYTIGLGLDAAQNRTYQLGVERLQRRMGRSVL